MVKGRTGHGSLLIRGVREVLLGLLCLLLLMLKLVLLMLLRISTDGRDRTMKWLLT